MDGSERHHATLLGEGSAPGWPEQLASIAEEVSADHGDIERGVSGAVSIGEWAPLPGSGGTLQLWELLGTVAAADVSAARILEPHLDALAILEQSPGTVALEAIAADGASSWGVFAAEGPGMRLAAEQDGETWRLSGVKPWCSLAGSLSHALVTAHTAESSRRLFAVDLRDPSVEADAGPWVARGLAQIVSAPVHFDGTIAVPVGEDQWYLERPGFSWGGMGVAACWWGGAVGLGRQLFKKAADSRDQLMLAHLGSVDAALTSARDVLARAAASIDRGTSTDHTITALRVRNQIAASVEAVLTHVAHALGPGPLTRDERFARRVADLQLYVRQHHAEHDEAALGERLGRAGGLPW